jgi:hypothetical protein
MPYGRQYLLQAADEFEMNEWISLINYASAFKTADVPIMAPLPTDPILSPPLNKRDSVFLDNHEDASPDVFGPMADRSGDPGHLDQLSPAGSFDSRRPSSSTMLTRPSTEIRDSNSRLDYLEVSKSGSAASLERLRADRGKPYSDASLAFESS